MPKFKSIYNDEVYDFSEPDADGMRRHPEYVEVIEVAVEEEPVAAPRKKASKE